jgi:hypothetical protein
MPHPVTSMAASRHRCRRGSNQRGCQPPRNTTSTTSCTRVLEAAPAPSPSTIELRDVLGAGARPDHHRRRGGALRPDNLREGSHLPAVTVAISPALIGPKHRALLRSAVVVIAALALGVLTANADRETRVPHPKRAIAQPDEYHIRRVPRPLRAPRDGRLARCRARPRRVGEGPRLPVRHSMPTLYREQN